MAENELNGAAAPPESTPRTLREVAEAAWDEVVENAPEDGAQPESGQDGRERDSLGRFVARQPGDEPGEQSGQPQPDPAPKPVESAAPAQPIAQPAPSGTEAPQHWPAADREAFAKLKDGSWEKEFLVRRNRETEADYTRKTQAAATAVQFTNALAPEFQDPVISQVLQKEGLTPFDAIRQLLHMQRRAVDPDIEVRRALHRELGERMGLGGTHPAAGQMSQPAPGLSEQDLADPAIRFFADTIGRTSTELKALKDQIAAREQAAEVAQARWTIDQFAEEKDASGKPVHPHFDRVQPIMMSLLAANPRLTVQQVYNDAIWLDPELRALVVTEQVDAKRREQDLARAKQAARSNVRGMTSPVSKPQAGDGKPLGLRGTIEAAADDLGL